MHGEAVMWPSDADGAASQKFPPSLTAARLFRGRQRVGRTTYVVVGHRTPEGRGKMGRSSLGPFSPPPPPSPDPQNFVTSTPLKVQIPR